MSKPNYLPHMKIADKPLVPIHEQILEAMNDLEGSTIGDLCWVGPTETIFERLGKIYLSAGGSYTILKDQFPQYYD